jgi:hypothetical protein
MENNDAASSEPEKEAIPARAFYMATVFIFFTGGFYFFWLSIYGVNTVFFEGYPQLGTLLPGTLYSARYWDQIHWWMVWLLSWNAAAPMALAMALTHNRIREWTQVHKFVCIWLMLLNLVVLVTLTVLWIIGTNNSFSGVSTAANDYRYCCVFWPNNWCPNNAPCVFNPPLALTSSSQLIRNSEMTAHWAFSFVFLLLTYWNLLYSRNLRRNYGVLIKI